MESITADLIGHAVEALTTIAVGAFIYGKLTEKVNGHGSRINALELAKDDHGTRIARLEGAQSHAN